jgi:hypothetical protein
MKGFALVDFDARRDLVLNELQQAIMIQNREEIVMVARGMHASSNA